MRSYQSSVLSVCSKRILFFAITALCACFVATSAFAQDDDSTESPSEPLPSLDVNPTPLLPTGNPAPPVPTREGGIETAPIARTPEDAADILEYFDIDESLLRQLIDNRPLDDDEKEAVVRILFALPKLPEPLLQNWTVKSPDWEAIIEAPEEYRTNIYQLNGQVTRVEKVPLIAEAAQRFGFTHYYQATVELGEDRWKSTVCARRVPLDWKIGEPINESVSFRGLFLKLGDGPVFATKRIAWHPNRLDEEMGITRSHVVLGDLGLDVGLWDDVRDRRPLLPTDRECFYQLLHSIGRIRQEKLREHANPSFNFADIIRRPKDFHGKMLRLEGVARRCAKIVVSDSDIRARFGIEHYYEIYLILHLETKIVYKDDQTGETLEFQTFPVAICAREIPPGMPQGDDINEAVSISGVFFKLWEYDSRKMASFNAQQDQPCPMFFVLRPDFIGRESFTPYFGMTVGGMFVVALVGVWVSIWYFGREDAKFAKNVLKPQFALESGTSLNDMGLDAGGGPDFSHLTAAALAAERDASNKPKGAGITASVRQKVGQWIADRADPEEIREFLLDQGFEDSQLDNVYEQFGFTPRELRKRFRQAQHNRRMGRILIGAGTVMGLVSVYFQAMYGGGVVIALAIMAYGLMMMLTGENYLASLFFQTQSFAKTPRPERDA